MKVNWNTLLACLEAKGLLQLQLHCVLQMPFPGTVQHLTPTLILRGLTPAVVVAVDSTSHPLQS